MLIRESVSQVNNLDSIVEDQGDTIHSTILFNTYADIAKICQFFVYYEFEDNERQEILNVIEEFL